MPQKALRRRAGRKLKRAARTPSGQISRAVGARERQEDVRAVVWDQRRRHHGLTDGAERSQNAATYHGRLYERGTLSRDEFLICERYADAQRRFTITLGAPGLTGGARCYGETSGPPVLTDELCERAKLDFAAIVREFEGIAPLHSAVRDLVIKGRNPRDWESLRKGLGILAGLWGMPLDRQRNMH